MAARPTCPKAGCGKPAYRLYGQTQSPETKRSTSVPVPAVWCGEAVFANGHATFTTPKGTHGLVELTKGTFAAQVRNSRAAVAKLDKKNRKGGRPSNPDAHGRAKHAKAPAPRAKAHAKKADGQSRAAAKLRRARGAPAAKPASMKAE